jgi:hypothetical protein
MEDIPMRIRNSFVHVDFVVLKMDVCCQISIILGRPFLSTTRATIDVASRIIKFNIGRTEKISTFKPKGTEKCSQVMVMIRPERNAMKLDKNPRVARIFLQNFLNMTRMPPRLRQDLQSHGKFGCDKISRRIGELIFKGMQTVLLMNYKREALAGR